MTSGVEPTEPIPEADLVEQRVPIDAPVDDDEDELPPAVGTIDEVVDQADRLDQWRPVVGDDDEYPPDVTDA